MSLASLAARNGRARRNKKSLMRVELSARLWGFELLVEEFKVSGFRVWKKFKVWRLTSSGMAGT